MKNKYSIKQISDVYNAEIGVNIQFMENYLTDLFNGNDISKYDILFSAIETNSDFFPELNKEKRE